MKIPLSRPDITEKEENAVRKVLKTPHLSLGPKLYEFEEKIAEYVGVKYAVAVNSGTSALHLIIRALGIKEGDEIITTPFSFIASANCILFERATPVFVDIEPDTLNIDPEKIKSIVDSQRSTVKAILAVDVFGLPCNWDELETLAKRYDLKLIEDSAEALGSRYLTKNGWKKCGSFGNAGVFAFYPNKQITTGEGGTVLTNNQEVADLCRSMANQGREVKNGKWLEHVRLGYNYRISDINCAIGIAQLERIDEILEKRRKVAETYNRLFKEVKGVKILYEDPGFKRSWFVYVIQLEEKYEREDRNRILKKLKEKGIECSNYFTPIHLQPFYRRKFGYKEGDFPVTESVSARTIALPFYNNLSEEEVEYIVNNLKKLI